MKLDVMVGIDPIDLELIWILILDLGHLNFLVFMIWVHFNYLNGKPRRSI